MVNPKELVLTHFGDEVIDLGRIYPLPETPYRNAKPRGLWLSDESDHGWSKWCEDEGFRDTSKQARTEFTLAPGANVLHLTTTADVLAFSSRYPLPPNLYGPEQYDMNAGGVDWIRVREEYNGLLITPYSWAARLDSRAAWYYGWDCASACIWHLSAIQQKG